MQEGGDQCAVYLQAAVVADEALLPEAIHKFTDPSGRHHHNGENANAHPLIDVRAFGRDPTKNDRPWGGLHSVK